MYRAQYNIQEIINTLEELDPENPLAFPFLYSNDHDVSKAVLFQNIMS